MPAATRSNKTAANGDDTSTTTKGTKRKATEPAAGKAKKVKNETETEDKKKQPNSNLITINRAPVLTLWCACVAHLLYDDLHWTTCLSVGGAIAAICAISKGQAIGAIGKPDAAEAERRRAERREKAKSKEGNQVEVVGFDITIDSGSALVSGRPHKVNESTLQHKYEDGQYQKLKSTFEKALKAWSGREEELNSLAFKMYEDFRPTVPPGQKGWGKKGQIDLTVIQNTIKPSD